MVIIGPVSDEQEGVLFSSDEIKFKIDRKLLNTGKLFITESALKWRPLDSEEGITIPWLEVSLHAITNNTIYLMLDFVFTWQGIHDPGAQRNGNGVMDGEDQVPVEDEDDDEGNESDCDPEITEIWLIPSNVNCVETIFNAIKQCQSLNPDPEDVSEDEGEYMAMDEDEPEDGDHQEEVGQGNMRNLNINEDRFADAEDD